MIGQRWVEMIKDKVLDIDWVRHYGRIRVVVLDIMLVMTLCLDK